MEKIERILEFGRDYYSVINVTDTVTLLYVEDLDSDCTELLIKAVRIWNKTFSYLAVSQYVKSVNNISERDRNYICKKFKILYLLTKKK